MPSIRPLETLHNALSLRQLDFFLEYATSANFKTPCQSPPRLMPRTVLNAAAHGLPQAPGQQQDGCKLIRRKNNNDDDSSFLKFF
jgi:inositol hexakisphosphate/diphosphoinositol-pentakisphosphate kinase